MEEGDNVFRTDEEFVRRIYPKAGTIMLNKGLYYVGSEGEDGSKMGAGERLSGQFRRESEAWADAARRLREAD